MTPPAVDTAPTFDSIDFPDSSDSSVHHSAVSILCSLLSTSDPNSVFSRLYPFFEKADKFLDPSPPINQALSHLVAVLQASHSSVPSSSIPFVFIAKQVCQWIDSDPQLQLRSTAIRDIAKRAESRLELFYAKKIVNDISFINPSSSTFVEKVAFASQKFPYIDNYLIMVEQEAQIIQKFRANPKHIVFCGSGPLPFTGILLAVHTMADHITFVDHDLEAVIWSKKLIQKWELDNIIPKGRVHVIHCDASLLKFKSSSIFSLNDNPFKDNTIFNCDVLFVAALIPNTVKCKLFKTVKKLQHEAPIVVLRTAHGLTARLAYDSVSSKQFKSHLSLIATIVPKTHASSLDKPPQIDNDQRCPLDWFPEEILNSLELYAWNSSLHPKSY